MSIPTIINQPDEKVYAAYRPIIYEIETTDVLCYTTKQVSGDVYVNGVLHSTIYTDVPFYDVSGIKRWRLDISTVLQEAMKNKIQPIGTGTPALIPEMCKEVYVIFNEWSTYFNPYFSEDIIFKSNGYLPADDLTTPGNFFGLPPTSDIIYVLDATLQHYEIQNLNDYLLDGLGGVVKALTHKPKKSHIYVDDSEFIYYLIDRSLVYYISFKYYNASGTYITGGVNIYTPGGSGIALAVFGIGVTNIIDLFGIDLPAGTAYYTVQVTALSQSTEIRTYFIKENCCEDKVRVHFKNLLGGFDSTTLEVFNKEEFNPVKTSYTKGLPLNFSIKDRGRNTLASTGSIELTASKQMKNREDALWLTEISTSPDVFIEKTINGTRQYYPYEVKAEKITLLDDDESDYTLKYSFTESHSRIVQHN